MKILIIRPWARIGYGNTYNVQGIGLAKALIRMGHQCDLVYFNGRNKSKVEQYRFDNDKVINIYSLKGFDLFGNGIFFGLKKMISNYDIVQTSEYEQLTSWYLYTFYPKKTVLYHGPYTSKFKRKYNLKCTFFDIFFKIFTNVSKVNCIAKSHLAEEFLLSKGFKNVTSLGVGLDCDRFIIDHKFDSFVEDLRICKDNKKYILYIGLLEERRNINFLLDVYEKLFTKNNQIELIIIGKANSEYGRKCLDRINRINTGNIHYKESLEQQNIGDLYRICDAFVFPSKYEIYGMVILESMYFGLPIVSSYNGGSSMLIKNGVNGFIIKDFDLDTWVNQVENLVQSKDLESIKVSANLTIVNNFTWNALAHSFLNKYIEVLEGKNE